jgi:uncharacterized protein YceH (UPF0502 family)
MHTFDELTDVLAGLQKLMEREPPLAAVLPRQPGTKEARYMHLLSGPVEALRAAAPDSSMRPEGGQFTEQNESHEDRIAQLEATVAELRQEVAALRAKIDDLFGD